MGGPLTEETIQFGRSNELKDEGDRMVGDDIAEEGIKYLKTINFSTNLDALEGVSAAD